MMPEADSVMLAPFTSRDLIAQELHSWFKIHLFDVEEHTVSVPTALYALFQTVPAGFSQKYRTIKRQHTIVFEVQHYFLSGDWFQSVLSKELAQLPLNAEEPLGRQAAHSYVIHEWFWLYVPFCKGFFGRDYTVI